jgi:7,8-dihydropterin-6-yl-methyl-4-(beta-D-ribofuranosyl)aminobenzene 5'-phosphate synthase
MKPHLSRRHFVLGSACVLAQAGLWRSALAQAPKLRAVPVVDSLTVKVLIDQSYDTPRLGASKWVKVKRAPPYIPAGNVRRVLHNQWGLSLGLESRIGSDTRDLMLDFGYTPEALLNNMALMGVDGGKTQAMILSHGHFDHFGGMLGYLQKYRDKLPADLTLYVGGEDNFCLRKAPTGGPGNYADYGLIDRREIEAFKVKIVYCEQPTVVMGHAFTTGTIARRSFEKVLPNTIVEYDKKNGLGCDIPAASASAAGKAVADEHLHEHGTCFHVKDRGLVVMSSCGHSGVLNTVLQAREVSGVNKVHAVLGGFHLFPATEDYLRRTVAELKTLDPDVVIPFHCSGPGFVNVMRETLGDRLFTSTTGTEFTFGA